MKGIYEAYEDFRNAERMFNYAIDSKEIDTAISLMDIANRKIKAYKNIDPKDLEIRPLNETPPTMLELIKRKLRKGESVWVTIIPKSERILGRM